LHACIVPLRLPGSWAWDSWLARDDGEHHLFFLHAPRSLTDPDARHDHAAIGHARSDDLRTWEVLPAALTPAAGPAWDDMALWTGSVARGPDGVWRLFYTGRSHADRGRVQRIGVAVSDDLTNWSRRGRILEADPRWYEPPDWRDPCVIEDPNGDGWHMLITARAPGGGVIGHARSSDLNDWEIQPPLSRPAGFRHLEVPRVADIDGPVLMFSCWRGGRGVWIARGETLLGPWDIEAAEPLDHPSLYAANFVRDGAGGWSLLGFRDAEHSVFVGEITDPLPIERCGGTVRLRV
jgi:beta-fructofuranosidase